MKLWFRTIASIWMVSLGIAGMIIAYQIFVRVDAFPNLIIWKVFLALGLSCTFFGVYIYTKRPGPIDGFRFNPKWVAFFYDFINLFMGILAAFLFLNFMMLKLNMNVIVDEESLLYMGVYYYILGIPFVTYFSIKLASQVIKITKKFIDIIGIENHQKIHWNDVQEIYLKDEYIVTAKSGIIYRQKLQNKMVLASKTGERLIINEPQTKKAKNELYHILSAHIPDRLKSALDEVFANWMRIKPT